MANIINPRIGILNSYNMYNIFFIFIKIYIILYTFA